MEINVIVVLPTRSGEDKTGLGTAPVRVRLCGARQRAGLSGGALVHMLPRMADGTLVCPIYLLLVRVQLRHTEWLSMLQPMQVPLCPHPSLPPAAVTEHSYSCHLCPGAHPLSPTPRYSSVSCPLALASLRSYSLVDHSQQTNVL